jgi:hypothetical protein
MCATSRMVVKHKGAAQPSVIACTTRSGILARAWPGRAAQSRSITPLRQILRARRGCLQPGLMRRSGATQADTSTTIRDPALVGATRLFRHEGRRHPMSRRQAALSLPVLIGDRFYKPPRPVVAGRQVLRPGPIDRPAAR